MPEWMFGECYSAVGDFAEVMALLLPPAAASTDLPLHYWVEERMLPMREWDDGARRDSIVAAWRQMDERQRFAWNKLLTGEFRVGVSQSLVVRAIAQVSGVDAARDLASADGRLAADARIRDGTAGARHARCRCQPAVSVLPGLSAGGRGRGSGRYRRMAGGVEVGRHPRAVDPARVADVPVVARRRTDDRPLSGTGRGGRAAAGGHGDRWRSDAVEGGRARCRSRRCSAASGERC